MDNKEFILKGLCCANCAAKIEKEVSDLPAVEEANINLANCKLKIKLKEGDCEELEQSVKEIVASHEPSVKVINLNNKVTNSERFDSKPDEEHPNGNQDIAHEDEHGHNHDDDEGDSDFKFEILRLVSAIALSTLVSFLNVSEVIKLVVYFISLLLAGHEILITAGKNILKGRVFDENFLMSIASIGAFIIGERLEAVAVLVFYALGELLQDMAVHRSRKNIAGLMDIRPDYANLKLDDSMKVVSPEQVQRGDIIMVKPGEKIPLDGVVVKGNSYVDTRALTGESVPVEVNIDDSVYSGSINTSGVIEIEVTKPFGESTVSKILEMVENAGSKKAESEKFITRFARYYTPIVVITAVLVALLPPLLGFGPFFDWIYRALSFLIISCPCALVISIPLSFFGGIGGSAKHGILIKGGNYLEALNQVDTIVFDKTGTLTKGVFEVTNVLPAEGVEARELIQYAAIAEQHSTHPIAKSILSYYKDKLMGDPLLETEQITELAGHGIIAQLEQDVIYAGNEKLMKEYNIAYEQASASGSIVYVATDNRYLGSIIISDEVKQGAKETMHALKSLGVKRTVMLTGDQEGRAKEIAEYCQIDDVHAELLPQDKVSWFDHYKKQIEGKGKIAFVGDGINDAPVLAGADIGIAMGGIGSDAAIEAADVVIMNDDISRIASSIKIARKTRKIVTQNIVFALGVKLLIMLLAFFDISSIWFAIFADVGVALIALMNAMRAMYIK